MYRASRFTEVDALIERELGSRYTAAVVRIEERGACVYERAVGTTFDRAGSVVAIDTRFDLASITKVFVATVILARYAQLLDASLGELVPELEHFCQRGLTLRHLLAHTGGFRSGADYRTLLDRNVETFAIEEPLLALPGARVIYSDIGFIVAGIALRRLANRALHAEVEDCLAALGANATTYLRRVPAREAIVATEDDAWRGRVVGAVHDEKAALLGGVAGHAGLFGTARDVALLAEWYLAAHVDRPTPLDCGVARLATAEAAFDPVLRRGLGWALKTSDENSSGALMSSETFGHTGFTGTCVWADPRVDRSITILTNAVYFSRQDTRLFRAAICDAAMRA